METLFFTSIDKIIFVFIQNSKYDFLGQMGCVCFKLERLVMLPVFLIYFLGNKIQVSHRLKTVNSRSEGVPKTSYCFEGNVPSMDKKVINLDLYLYFQLTFQISSQKKHFLQRYATKRIPQKCGCYSFFVRKLMKSDILPK